MVFYVFQAYQVYCGMSSFLKYKVINLDLYVSEVVLI
jgi:hypothetical protein